MPTLFSLPFALLPLLHAFLASANPIPQSTDSSSSTPTTPQPLSVPSQPTQSSTTDTSNTSNTTNSVFDKSNIAYLVLGVVIIILGIGVGMVARRRRHRAILHTHTTQATLQRDLSALSASMYHIRTRSQGTNAGAMGSVHGAWARERDRYRNHGDRRSGRPASSGGYVDGMRLDVDEHGEAPPVYVKESGDRALNVRTDSVRSEDEGSRAATPNEARGEIELSEMIAETMPGRLPDYVELEGSTVTVPNAVHRAM